MAILSLVVTPKKYIFDFLLFTFAFLLLDVTFGLIGIYNYSRLTAVVTGLLFGSAIFFFLLNELHHNKFFMKYEK
jgi:hypothetical protein